MQLNSKVPVILCLAYHRLGLDDDVWRQWSRDTQGGNLFFLGLGDFNSSRDQVEASPWLSLLNAVVVKFEGITCSSGKGRAIDFVVCSKELAPLISVSVEWGHPWSPHAALRVRLCWDLDTMFKWMPKRPSQWNLDGLHQVPTDGFDDILAQTKNQLEGVSRFRQASSISQNLWS